MLVFPSLGPGASMPKDEVESTIGKPSLAVPPVRKVAGGFLSHHTKPKGALTFLKKGAKPKTPSHTDKFCRGPCSRLLSEKRVVVIWDFTAIFARTEIRAEDRDRSCWAKRLSDPGSTTQDVPVRPWNSMTSRWLYHDARLLSSIHDLTRKPHVLPGPGHSSLEMKYLLLPSWHHPSMLLDVKVPLQALQHFIQTWNASG